MDWYPQNKYSLLLKTGDAEIRAAKYFTTLNNLLPIIELTRGRKSKNDQEGNIKKRIDQIVPIFKKQEVILDITSDPALSNTTIDQFYSPENGYEAWTEFLETLKKEHSFSKIYPTIMFNWEEDPDANNLKLELKKLYKSFDGIAYRSDIEDDGFLDDITAIRSYVQDFKYFFFIIDCGYLRYSNMKDCEEKSINRIQEIKKILPNTTFILLSTSYPNNVGDNNDDVIDIKEIQLYHNVSSSLESDIIYGDYGSINPVRNDDITMARGWRPKIDVPLEKELYYSRRRKGSEKHYSPVYNTVARIVTSNSKFPKHLTRNWGIKQIQECASGSAPGATPSFWISVRMNIHVEQQLRRLKLLS